MRVCKCGINGGKHLFKDCLVKQQKEAILNKVEMRAAPNGEEVARLMA